MRSLKKKSACLTLAFGCLAAGAARAAEVTVDNVTDLTNQIATVASGSTIYLAKGRYDVSDCRGNLMGGYDRGLLGIPNGKQLTLAGASGTARGDVVIDAPAATMRLLYINKGSLACTNLTFTGSAGGAIHVGNADAKLYLYGCVFSNLTADAAAAVSRSYVGTTIVSNCLFADCAATNSIAGACKNLGEVTDCVYTNCTSVNSGGAVSGGSYVRCAFYDCKFDASKVGSPTSTGGGAVAGAGFCTDCTFVGCETTGGRGEHGAAIYNVAALTNCTFRGCKAVNNELVGVGKGWAAYPVVNCTFENNETPTLLSGHNLIQNSKIVGHKGGALASEPDAVVANTLVASNSCASAQGIFGRGRFVNCTFIGNSCSSGRASDSILGEACVAINCLFYQNRAHNITYNDMAMRFASDDLTSPLCPYLTNCVWSAEVTYGDAHKTAAYARTANSQLDANLVLNLTGASGAPFYALGKSDFARRGGLVTDEIRELLGTRDLAGNTRFAGSGENQTISLGCYQHRETGLMLIVR